MSTTTEDKKDPKDKDPKAAKGDVRAKSQVEPVIRDEAFFNWLEELFFGPEQFPEKLDCRVISGPNGVRLGPYIKQIVFAPTTVKPTKEELVTLSNRLLFEMQRDCDQARKRCSYGVHAVHFARTDEPFYARFTFSMTPKSVHSNETGEHNGYDEDDDSLEGMSSKDKLIVQTLKHKERLLEIYTEAIGGAVDRLDRTLERADKRIQAQDATIAHQNEMMERALSQEAERKERHEWTQLKIKSAEKALDLGLNVAPVLLDRLTGKGLPGGPSGETLAIRNLFRLKEDGGLLTQAQTNVVFGVYDENPPHATLQPGILSAEQAKLLYDIGNNKVSADELDRLLPGGDMAINMDQFQGLMKALTLEQLLPLQLIFEGRQKRRQQAMAEAADQKKK